MQCPAQSENKLKMQLVPFTDAELSKLKGVERTRALRIYHDFLKEQRCVDLKISKTLRNKIYNFENREKNREQNKAWYLRVRDTEEFKRKTKKRYQGEKNNPGFVSRRKKYRLEYFKSRSTPELLEKSRAKDREYYSKNKEKINKKKREWRHRRKELNARHKTQD